MALLSEKPHPLCFLVSEPEGGPFRGRDAASIGPNQTLLPGQILGAVGVPANMTAAALADAGNTGNGTLTPDATTPVLASAKDGVYRVVFNAPTTFTVEDPTGKEFAKGQVGTPFAKDIKFLIAAGGTAFVAGDAFAVQVVREAIRDEQFVALNLSATDGSAVVRAIACYPVTTASNPVRSTIFNGPGEVRATDLIWPAGITAPQQAAAVEQLRRLGIKLR